jgi:hypothetical protein
LYKPYAYGGIFHTLFFVQGVDNMFKQSVFRIAASVAVATSLVAASGAASAVPVLNPGATVTLTPNILFLLGVGGVAVSGSGSGTYALVGDPSAQSGSFSAPLASTVAVDPAGGLSIAWAPDAQLNFYNAEQDALLSFSGLVFDTAKSVVTADLHFVRGTNIIDFNDSVVFSVGALSAPLATLQSGGTVTANVALSKAGLSGPVAQLNIPFPGSTDIAAGTVTFVGTPTASVPELSTGVSMLMGLGLLGAAVSRRRAK